MIKTPFRLGLTLALASALFLVSAPGGKVFADNMVTANTTEAIASAKTALLGKTDLAKGKTATASSEQAGNEITHGVDGDDTTRWCASDGSSPQWYSVDLGSVQSLSGFHVLWEKSDFAYQYKVEVSNDNQDWTVVADRSTNALANQDDYVLTPKAKGRYVKLTILNANDTTWASLFTFAIFGA